MTEEQKSGSSIRIAAYLGQSCFNLEVNDGHQSGMDGHLWTFVRKWKWKWLMVFSYYFHMIFILFFLFFPRFSSASSSPNFGISRVAQELNPSGSDIASRAGAAPVGLAMSPSGLVWRSCCPGALGPWGAWGAWGRGETWMSSANQTWLAGKSPVYR